MITHQFCLLVKNLIIVIQQQTFEQEGNEAFKLGKMRPSVAGLGDSKYTSRDSNIVLGLFSPMRFGLTEYMGYNIGKFRFFIHFTYVLGCNFRIYFISFNHSIA